MQGGRNWVNLDARLLRRWPLPAIDEDADKEARGRVLVVAGSREIPGAAVLAAIAALRAGAGKVLIATGQSVAGQMAFEVPEARVIALPETQRGSFSKDGLALLQDSAEGVDATLIGSGLMDEGGSTEFASALLPMLAQAPVVLDALAMNVLKTGRLTQPAVVTPHAGEMAHLTGNSKEEIVADPERAVIAAADQWNAVVALKGGSTLIASPGAGRWRHQSGQPGLGTSGSGDVLAGVMAGLLAQGAPLDQACAWGVVLHAMAGARLSARLGPIGYLARELPGEIPALLKKLRGRGAVRSRPSRPRE